jgi:hypothetical protein
MVILAGRIDSGWVHLALFRPDEAGPHLLRSASLPVDEHGGLRQILRRFVAEDLPALRAACIAMPGPPGSRAPVAQGLAEALGQAEVEVVDAGALDDAGDAGDATLQGLARRAVQLIQGDAG